MHQVAIVVPFGPLQLGVLGLTMASLLRELEPQVLAEKNVSFFNVNDLKELNN